MTSQNDVIFYYYLCGVKQNKREKMILINSKQIDEAAYTDANHPLHSYAVQVKKGMEELKKTFGKTIRFKRPGFPKATEGVDHRGAKIPRMAKPTPPLRLPLKARVAGKLGEEIWEICSSAEPLPNNLWKATGTRFKGIEETITISLDKEPELAFFIYYKSSAMNRRPGKERKGILIIDDPTFLIEQEYEREKAEYELQTGLMGVLAADEERLRVVASSYGVTKADTKIPALLIKELKAIVLQGELKKKRDPMAKGIKEFLDEIKITDAVRLRGVVMNAEDKGILVWDKGRYTVGDRLVMQISPTEQHHRFEYLCNHLGNSANRAKLQDLLRDVINKDYLDKIKDEKTFAWIGRMMELKTAFKDAEQVREMVYEHFCGKADETPVEEPTVKEEPKIDIAELKRQLMEELKKELATEPVVKATDTTETPKQTTKKPPNKAKKG